MEDLDKHKRVGHSEWEFEETAAKSVADNSVIESANQSNLDRTTETTKSSSSSIKTTKPSSSCTVCQKTFSQAFNLRRHFENVHGRKRKNMDSINVPLVKARKQEFQCEDCSKVYATAYNLKRHMKNHD